MEQQLSIEFDPHLMARRSDPETSHKASERALKFARGQAEEVFDCLVKYGPQTADEIAKRTKLTSVQICRRLPDLLKKHMAEPTGITRPSASNCQEREWRAI